jgi:hypothetical protein
MPPPSLHATIALLSLADRTHWAGCLKPLIRQRRSFSTLRRTDFCVDATVRSTVSNDHHVVAVSDAHTLSDRPHLPATSIIAHHNWLWSGLITNRSVSTHDRKPPMSRVRSVLDQLARRFLILPVAASSTNAPCAGTSGFRHHIIGSRQSSAARDPARREDPLREGSTGWP